MLPVLFHLANKQKTSMQYVTGLHDRYRDRINDIMEDGASRKIESHH